MIEYVIGFTVVFTLCCAFEYGIEKYSARRYSRDIKAQERKAFFLLYPCFLYPELYERGLCLLTQITPEEFGRIVEARKVRFGTQTSEPPLPPT